MNVMRVGIIALQHESNTFMPRLTTLEDFSRVLLARGDEVRRHFEHAHHEVGGFFEAMAGEGIEAVPLFAARAVPSGTIAAETLDALLAMMLEALNRAGPLDGLLVAPHGAAVAASQPDMDGYWLTRLRQRVSQDIPIISTLDPHANLSKAMVAACDATIAYRTNPHLDQRQRGLEAGRLMARTLRGEIKPVQAAAFPPVAINIERQCTSEEPCASMYALAEAIRNRPGILSVSVMLGFPYADVVEMGSAFVVVADGDAALAALAAQELSDYLYANRRQFAGVLVPPDVAVDLAMRSPHPACLLDMGDNIGGGSPGDGTVLLHLLQDRGIRGLVSICDAQSAKQSFDAGVGSELELSIGGKTDERHGPPLMASATVRSLHEGTFGEMQVRHGGASRFDMGPTAIVETLRGVVVQLTSRRTTPFSLNQLLSCGLRPSDFAMIVVKGVHAPVAAYAEVCPFIQRVNTPGITTADMSALQYRHRRKPLFPLEII